MTKRPANLVSHTELSTLAQCEMKWHLRYREGLKSDESAALILGRLIDATAAAFWRGDDWRTVLREAIAEEGADPTRIDLDALDGSEGMEVAAKANWLMQRYDRHYADLRRQVKVVGQQLDLRAKLPGSTQTYQAIIDDVWELYGDLWVVERKTYGRRDRLELVEVDPQLTNNLWVARENGIDAVGVVFDGIYTYRWVGPRPDSESFDLLWLDRTDDHISAAHREVKALASRRLALRRGAQPIRNVSPLCKSCGNRETCFERLAFPQSIELVSS
jgi:hypothetical protein